MGKDQHTQIVKEHYQHILEMTTHTCSHDAIVSFAQSTPSLIFPLGSTWKWVSVLAPTEQGVCHSTTDCKTEMNLNTLDFPLSFSSCRLCTNLYLSSHHTSAWEWLASPQGHSIWSLCFIYTNTHTFIMLLLHFPPRLAIHSVLGIRRQEVLQ